jgi:CheY-like chemotaxis protein
MASVVSLYLDAARVEGVLSQSARRVTCREAVNASAILARAGARPPDLIVLGGEAATAADAAETLIDDPMLFRTPLVAWAIRGSLADTSRLLAAGVRVVTGDEDALRGACEETLDAHEGRTIRVDAQTELEAPAGAVPDLYGRRVIVADDDPAIRWFFADLLRAQGCDVEDVPDGEAALDRARRMVPDLLVSDIRMPRLDGVRLCRAMRADALLADVPVVLLSWKEDWLRRAEDSGIEASAYLAKRSTPEEVLMLVHQLLEPHARFERRLREPGAVRGRLDGTAPYRLLRLACATHADARLTVRCAQNAYEVHLRDGAPRAASRVNAEGPAISGAPALALLLDERVGRFTLNPARGLVEPDLSGTLHQQMEAYAARSRGGVDGGSKVAHAAASALAPSTAAKTWTSTPASTPTSTATPASTSAPLPMPTSAPSVPVASIPQRPSLDVALSLAVRQRPTERAQEPLVHTLRMAPRSVAPGAAVAPPAPAGPELERTLPITRPAPRRLVAPPPPSATTARSPRSWGVPLRWVGVAAIAALGIVLGAGVRALRQPPAAPRTTSAPAAPLTR